AETGGPPWAWRLTPRMACQEGKARRPVALAFADRSLLCFLFLWL
ncbi:unnamed protein product, partial [marine sediment metagenome]